MIPEITVTAYQVMPCDKTRGMEIHSNFNRKTLLIGWITWFGMSKGSAPHGHM